MTIVCVALKHLRGHPVERASHSSHLSLTLRGRRSEVLNRSREAKICYLALDVVGGGVYRLDEE